MYWLQPHGSPTLSNLSWVSTVPARASRCSAGGSQPDTFSSHTFQDRGNPHLWPWLPWRCRPRARFRVKFCLLTVLFGLDKPTPSLNKCLFPLPIVGVPVVFLAAFKWSTWCRAYFFCRWCAGFSADLQSRVRPSSSSLQPSAAVPSGSTKRPVSPQGGSPAHTNSGSTGTSSITQHMGLPLLCSLLWHSRHVTLFWQSPTQCPVLPSTRNTLVFQGTLGLFITVKLGCEATNFQCLLQWCHGNINFWASHLCCAFFLKSEMRVGHNPALRGWTHCLCHHRRLVYQKSRVWWMGSPYRLYPSGWKGFCHTATGSGLSDWSPR